MDKIEIPKHIDFVPRKGTEGSYHREPAKVSTLETDYDVWLEKSKDVLLKDKEYQGLSKNLADIALRIPYKGEDDKERWSTITLLNKRYDELQENFKGKTKFNKFSSKTTIGNWVK